ncbi:transcriptional regulator [Mycolicibacterium tokaiense]|uniref:Glycerol operon regulatory protein n=1 Tax=Mycolicibacterium tokaiense TaxID=39695 RepID=A0A378TC77_9MYCO|nr:IclR family transcriptional regulator [Mycolicibacterium tokaiense]STZ58369.1 transcriptional regulator [Mycolicibacterium tokaiense]
MPEGTRGSEPVRVLVKAMAVLELLAQSPEPLSLGEIATKLELNKSTCYRILDTLAAGGFAERPSSGLYRLGIGAFRIGAAMNRHMDVRERTLPAMRRLFRVTGETVFLLVRRDNEAVCVERLDGRYATAHTLLIGGSLPLHTGAGPRLLLAAMSDGDRKAYLDGAFAKAVGGSEEARTRLADQLDDIRLAGYAVSDDDVEVGVRAISAPVRNLDGEVIAALSISGLTAHLPDSELAANVELLTGAAQEASRAMGHQG